VFNQLKTNGLHELARARIYRFVFGPRSSSSSKLSTHFRRAEKVLQNDLAITIPNLTPLLSPRGKHSILSSVRHFPDSHEYGQTANTKELRQ
jgi:hypothetical protein